MQILRKIALIILSFGIMAQIYADELLIGVEVPLTGKLALVGNGMLEGIKVAADVFNRSQSAHKVKLIVVDDESSPAKAISAVEKLASQKVLAITGGYGSNNIGPASDAAHKLGLPYITSGGVAEGLTQRGYKGFFRINNTAGYQKAVMGLLHDMQAKSVAIIYSSKEATSSLAKSVEASLSSQKVQVTRHEFDPHIRDFKPIINKIRLRDKPEVILMVGYENDYVGILRAAKVLKPKVKAMVGVWSLATTKMANKFADLVPWTYGTALLPFPAKFLSADGQNFSRTYKKLFNKDPDYLGQFGYVQTMLLLQAIERAYKQGKPSSKRIISELRKTSAETLIGKVEFDDNGDNPHFVHRMGQHQQDKTIAVIWPKANATSTMRYPATPW